MDGMKYDKVVEMNQKIGKQNARIVEKEIERMIENGERVTVAALQRYTGFSNSFFYKNLFVKFCMKQFESRISVIKITLLRCVLNKR